MFSPSSKAWILKYFSLIESGEIVLKNIPALATDISEEVDVNLNNVFAKSGLVYGFPTRMLFCGKLVQTNWTNEERFKVLLFESLLLIHFRKYGKVSATIFTEDVLAFYSSYNIHYSTPFLNYIIKEKDDEKLERIISKRTEIALKFDQRKTWFAGFLNAFAYLDVICFEAFLNNEKVQAFDYAFLAKETLAIIGMSAIADGKIDASEKNIFDVFLHSACLSAVEREEAKKRFEQGTPFEFKNLANFENNLFRRYLLDIAMLTVCANHETNASEMHFTHDLLSQLSLNQDELETARFWTHHFILMNTSYLPYLKEKSSVEFMVENVSKRWLKILGRNKDKLAKELSESKELLALIRKSTKEDLSKEEKDKIKTQFKDIVKSMPALAIFLLPGGAILLPLVLKIVPSLVPSAFRENEK